MHSKVYSIYVVCQSVSYHIFYHYIVHACPLHRGLALSLHVVQLLFSVSFLIQPDNVLLFHHIRQGEAARVRGKLASHTAWSAALVAGGLSAGLMIETTAAERGKMHISARSTASIRMRAKETAQEYVEYMYFSSGLKVLKWIKKNVL